MRHGSLYKILDQWMFCPGRNTGEDSIAGVTDGSSHLREHGAAGAGRRLGRRLCAGRCRGGWRLSCYGPSRDNGFFGLLDRGNGGNGLVCLRVRVVPLGQFLDRFMGRGKFDGTGNFLG